MSETAPSPLLSTIAAGSPPDATSSARTSRPAPWVTSRASTIATSAASASGSTFDSATSSSPASRSRGASSPVTQLAIVFASMPSAAASARSK